MNARRVIAITRRILIGFRRDRRTLALLFVAPIVILGLFYLLIRGGSTRVDVDVVNQDSGPLGGVVAEQLLSSSQVHAHQADSATAVRHLDDGTIAGYVLLPSDFSQLALGQREVAPEVHLEGSQPGLNQPVLLAVNQALLRSLQVAANATQNNPNSVVVPKLDVHVSYLHGGPDLDTLDYFGAAFIGMVVFFLVFVITIVSFLRERTQGTLERLMASPLRRGEIVVGYMLGFSVVAMLQAVEVILFALYGIHIYNAGPAWLIFVLTLLLALAAVNLGVFLSMFARTEFQAVQFIPIVIVPQVLLSGIVFPVSTEPGWLQWVSNVLPLTYAVDALRRVMVRGAGIGDARVQLDTAVVVAFVLLLIVASAATLRRRVA
jgi:ABC-2 type transport system permease protein